MGLGLDLIPLITAFSLVFVAELGDKTQLTAITLSIKSSAWHVFLGSMLAFFLVDGVSALLGGTLLHLLPHELLSLASGLFFLTFGVLSIVRKGPNARVEKARVGFFKAFSLVALMELGDKTQLASILLAAELGSPLFVLVGIMLAFSIVTGMGIVFGVKLLRRLPEAYMRIGASAFFIFFGLLFILSAINDKMTFRCPYIEKSSYSV